MLKMPKIHKVVDNNTTDPKKEDEVKYFPNKYEPKREYGWLLEIPGIDSFLFSRFTRPAWDGHTKSWDNLSAQMYDPIAPSGAQQVMEWIKEDKPRDCTIKLLSSAGDIIEEWLLKDTELIHADFGPLEYNSSAPCMITLILQLGSVELNF